jgi:hypothetical protein
MDMLTVCMAMYYSGFDSNWNSYMGLHAAMYYSGGNSTWNR